MADKSLLNESLETSKLHLKRAKFSYKQLQKINLDSELFNDEDKIQKVDSFIFRFLKLQDFMGQKLFKQLLKTTDDYQETMSMIDVLDKLEKMELVPSSDRWKDYREVRNQLTHEYPDNKEDVVSGIKKAMEYFPEIESIVAKMENYIKTLDF
jgi:uncharacterized protein YutE (UPF0331/DUF86 family)